MTTAYTSLLGLALPVTGELSGTWGDTVNDYITQYLDASVAGTQTISGSQTAVTLSKTTNAALTQAGTGATGSSQYSVINCTGNPASMLTVTVPAASKTYVVVNATSTNQDVKIVGAGPTTGVTLVAGEKAIIAWNGSDFIKVASSVVDGVSTISFGSTGLTPSTATSGAVTVAGTLVAANGGTGQSSYTTGDLLYATGATALSKLGIGTNGQILTSTGTAPQWSTLSGVAVTTFSAGTTGFTPNTPTSGAITLGGTLATTNGGTGLTSFTANRVFYASSTSAIAQSANLTFDGTTLTANALTTTSTVTINGGTANGVLYLNGSKVATAGSALTYNGTGLGVGSANPGRLLVLDGGATGAVLQMTNTAAGSPAGNGLEVTFDGTNTFLNNRPNGYMWFGVNATEQMRLTSTGLGIGTSSPGYRLTVAGTAGSAVVNLLETGVRSWGIRAGGTVTNTFDIADFTAGVTRLTIDSSGNLGIGTGSPGARLEVAGAIRLTDANPSIQGVSSSTGFFIDNRSVGKPIIFRVSSAATIDTTALTIDSAGNLGLGVTPSAWASGTRAFELGGTGSGIWGVNSVNFYSLTNSYYNGTNFIYATTAAATAYQQVNGRHQWLYAASGTAGASFTFTEGMRLDNSGNLGLGVTPSAWGGTKALEVSVLGSAMIAFSANNTQFLSNAYFNGTNWIYANNGAANRHQFNGGAYFWDNAASGTAGGTVTWTERMRLDSSGNLGIGTSSPASKLDVYSTGNTTLTISGSSGSGGDVSQIDFFRIGSNVTSSIKAIRDGSNTSGALTFYTATLGTNAEKMRLDSSGNLGIGTSSPGSFAGTVKTVIGGGSGNPVLTLYGGNATYSGIYFADGTTGNEQYRGFFEYNHANDSLLIGTSGATKATLDTSGNLGLGVTPSAWGVSAGSRALDVNAYAGFGTFGGATAVTYNSYFNSSNQAIYKLTGIAAEAYLQTNGQHQWYTAPSGTAGNAISFTQAMTLDASGRLLVGTTAKGTYGGNTVEFRGANIATLGGNDTGNLSIFTTDSQAANVGAVVALGGVFIGSTPYAFGAIAARKENSTSGNAQGYLQFYTTNSDNSVSEKARITSGGDVVVTGVGGLGYGTGSGGAVTQATSRTTGVTLDKTNGAITLVSAAGTTTWQTFTVTNNKVAATDTVIVNQKSGTDLYQIFVTNVAAGSFKISFATTGGTTTEQPVFNFAVIKAVTA